MVQFLLIILNFKGDISVKNFIPLYKVFIDIFGMEKNIRYTLINVECYSSFGVSELNKSIRYFTKLDDILNKKETGLKKIDAN